MEGQYVLQRPKSLLSRMHFVKRCATTKQPKMSSLDFEAGKAQFLYDPKVLIEMEEIPNSLVLNWDQTEIHYVPVSNWTMAKEGSKRVEIVELKTNVELLQFSV